MDNMVASFLKQIDDMTFNNEGFIIAVSFRQCTKDMFTSEMIEICKKIGINTIKVEGTYGYASIVKNYSNDKSVECVIERSKTALIEDSIIIGNSKIDITLISKDELSGDESIILIGDCNYSLNELGINAILVNNDGVPVTSMCYNPKSEKSIITQNPVGRKYSFITNCMNLEKRMIEIQSNLEKLKALIQAGKEQSFQTNLSLIKILNDDITNPKEVLFSNMCKADGDRRIVQLAASTLLSKAIKMMESHGIKYWVDGGTLLGTIRHNGFVPWDGDIDIAMFRSDYCRLKEILKDNEELCIKEKITIKAGGVKKSMRIASAKYVSPTIDVFIYDYCADDPFISDLYHKAKHYIKRKVKEMNDFSINEIDEVVQNALKKYLNGTTKTTSKIIWGLDNSNRSDPRIFNIDDVLPFKKELFESFTVNVPNNCVKYLAAYYGDIYRFPEDMLGKHNYYPSEKLKKGCIKIIETGMNNEYMNKAEVSTNCAPSNHPSDIISTEEIERLKRIYKNIPKATGNLRIVQLASIKILKEFDKLCVNAGIEYWVEFGTLLGTIRSNGYIPWDDDIDLSIERKDLKRLSIELKKSTYLRLYNHYIFYKSGVRNAYSIRVKGIDHPHLDLFIWDECSSDTDEIWDKYLEARDIIKDKCRNLGPTSTKEEKQTISRLLTDNNPEEMRNIGDSCGYIIWSIEEATKRKKRIFNKAAIYPLKRCKFEDIEVNVPNNPDTMLRNYYDDYWDIPDNATPHHGKFNDDDYVNGSKKILELLP